jgi:hypothetical protein
MVYPDQPTGETVVYSLRLLRPHQGLSGNDDHKFGSRLSMANGNGVVSTWAYRPDNRRLLEVTARLPTGYTFHNFNFTYDKVGNVTSLQNASLPPATIGGPASRHGADCGNQHLVPAL